ncbi:MAG TPA: archease [Deltaproteobacteria bacterium]|nr:archease [Deltaproteobacteria bacterium]HPR55759.1 archease [Deltaproteobacteria bacterium]HXK47525.1 archease [Deltaproteobacteria bacterium]
MPYTLIDHTADTGMRVSSPTVEGLFVEAALALCDIMGALTPGKGETAVVQVEGVDREDLLVRWLQEILYLVEVKGFRVAKAGLMELTDTDLRGELRGAYTGESLLVEVKAVTYHNLEIACIDNAYVAAIILDM